MMPLPPPAPRRPLHTRKITCAGFLRADGMWDIEAHIVDTKTYRYFEAFRGLMDPERPVHDMWIRLTIDADMVVRDVAAVTDAAPYRPCYAAAEELAMLVGIAIGSGWRKRVRERIVRTKGCTHLIELLDPLATTAFQTVSAGRSPDEGNPTDKYRNAIEPPRFLDGCRSWTSDGEVVRIIAPQFAAMPREGSGGP